MSLSEISGAIQISDNGKAFPVGQALLAKNPKRLGLVGMKERIEMAGESLTVESASGQDATVRAEIPLTQEQTKK